MCPEKPLAVETKSAASLSWKLAALVWQVSCADYFHSQTRRL